MRKQFIYISVAINMMILFVIINNPSFILSNTMALSAVGVIEFLILAGLYDFFQTKRTILRNYPLIGRARYIMEALRPKIIQYFVESDIDGRPISRIYRNVVYQRAKGDIQSIPFGTQLNVYEEGYEWLSHSLGAINSSECDNQIKVKVGNSLCTQNYNASIMNISAMSFGSLSQNAILALNAGAKIGGFAHNTGEGGISPYHLENKGDLIWQFGTGYFGCRSDDGTFNKEKYKDSSSIETVKMIEMKLSQGAKPGHGGILPAKKNTPEIAKIRGVEPYTSIISPSYHTAFKTPIELIEFIQLLRELSNGKPIGFKMCIGSRAEFIAICKAMVETKIYPDFIVIDGGEGGTGAAPMEYSNSVGMPLREALAFAVNCLHGFNLKQHIRIVASGKILTGFDIIKNICMGADMVNSARGMMLSLGCIQALECNKNICPTGITTQDPNLMKGLDVNNKKDRVARYHNETIHSMIDLLSATGQNDISKINRTHIFRRVSSTEIKTYDEIYPMIDTGAFLEGNIPKAYLQDFNIANINSFIS